MALMVAGLLAPVLAVDVPPLADYPNHLARCFFIAFGPHDAVMGRMFAVRWAVIPNLAIDLILPPLMHVMPPVLAGKAVVALTVLLPATGAVALSLACFRRRSLWQLGAGFVAYNTMFLVGSLNFQLAAGLALWTAAGWIALSPRRPVSTALAGAMLGAVIFMAHLFGFMFFAVLIGCAELASVAQRGLADAASRRFALGRSCAVSAALLPSILLYVTSNFASTGGRVVWQSLRQKLLQLLVPVLGYSRAESILVAAVLAAFVCAWGFRRRLRVAPLAWAAFPLLLLIYAVLPVGAKGGYWVDTRLPAMLGFMVFATLMPQLLSRREAVLATVVLGCLFVFRMGYITAVWTGSRQDVADVRQVLAPLTPGSRVLVADGDPLQHQWEGSAMPAYRVPSHGMASAYWHFGAFALIDHRAFWSDAFAFLGQQPVVTLPPYDASGDGGMRPPPGLAELGVYARGGTVPDGSSYLTGWPAKFDYVLVLASEAVPAGDDILPGRLTLLTHQGLATLFRVVR